MAKLGCEEAMNSMGAARTHLLIFGNVVNCPSEARKARANALS